MSRHCLTRHVNGPEVTSPPADSQPLLGGRVAGPTRSVLGLGQLSVLFLSLERRYALSCAFAPIHFALFDLSLYVAKIH